MTNTIASMRRKITSAADLQSVVRTMKAMAAANIGQYEKAERALGDYYHNVELALGQCLRDFGPGLATAEGLVPSEKAPVRAVVFGSDQGLVGRFNDEVADFAIDALRKTAPDPRIWVVGERVHGRLSDAGFAVTGQFAVPNSVQAIAPLVGQILLEAESQAPGDLAELHLFYNRPVSGASYTPVTQRLLPLDASWRKEILAVKWSTSALAEVLGDAQQTLASLIREYLFVSLFRACAESLASENASRLAAMQRADQNIDDLLATLNGSFHRLRQASIDEELFDVTAGFEALSTVRS